MLNAGASKYYGTVIAKSGYNNKFFYILNSDKNANTFTYHVTFIVKPFKIVSYEEDKSKHVSTCSCSVWSICL